MTNETIQGVRRAHLGIWAQKRNEEGGQPKTAYNSGSQVPLRCTQILLHFIPQNFWRTANVGCNKPA